jgi:hypothetical protein
MNWKLPAYVFLAVALAFSSFAATLVTSSVDGGGGRSSAGTYVNDGSIAGIGGISTVASPPETSKAGYIGQLIEVVSLTATGTPYSVNEGNTSQLSGSATLDDSSVTALAGSDIAWGFVTYPFLSVSSGGLLTALANVYANPVGTVNGSYLGSTGTASVQVLGPYANSGIADSWLVQYFGTPPNPNAAPTVDADGTGQNNLFKYVAGLDPTNPASVFVLNISPVPAQPGQKALTWTPLATGRTYTTEYRTNMVTGIYTNLTSYTGPTTNGTQVAVTDTNATQVSKFYRIRITYP